MTVDVFGLDIGTADNRQPAADVKRCVTVTNLLTQLSACRLAIPTDASVGMASRRWCRPHSLGGATLGLPACNAQSSMIK